MQKNFCLALILCGGLAACGDTIGEQAIIGGAAGLGAAVVTDGDPLVATLGGAAANVAYCQANPDKCDDAGLPIDL